MRSVLLISALLVPCLFLLGCDCSPGGSAACTVGGILGCPCGEADECRSPLVCQDGVCAEVSPTMDGGARMDAGDPFVYRDGEIPDVGPNPDAFFAEDPPPQLCLPDGGVGEPADPPGGTPECPDDKNREGCRCDEIGETAPCWPGLRVNRGRGICRDGTTTCEPFDEFTGRWGPCQGYVLPEEGVELGPRACRCFSSGLWELDNLSPCFVDYGPSGVYAVSTVPSTGQCPSIPDTPPPAPEGEIWSNNRLRVDCEGRFELCYTLKAGDAMDPQETDCTLSRVCTGEIWYAERDAVQELPPLPSWNSSNTECASQFLATGGYGEMTVVGLSVECDEISIDGDEYVFNRVPYCPAYCNEPARRDDPECVMCRMGGSGAF